MGQDSLEVLEVEIQDSYKEIKLIPGKVLPTQISNLAFEIPGIVYKINADIGDRFAKGDVLAELDSREVNANFMQAEARFKLSKLALDRFEDLKKDGFISAQEFDRASALARSNSCAEIKPSFLRSSKRSRASLDNLNLASACMKFALTSLLSSSARTSPFANLSPMSALIL